MWLADTQIYNIATGQWPVGYAGHVGNKCWHRNIGIKKWTVQFKDVVLFLYDIVLTTILSSQNDERHLCGSPFSPPYILKGGLIKENMASFLAVHMTQLTDAD